MSLAILGAKFSKQCIKSTFIGFYAVFVYETILKCWEDLAASCSLFLIYIVFLSFYQSKLQEKHPGASGFVFQTEIFTLDWGISNPAGNQFVTKYIMRTKTMWDRRKNIIIPENTQRGMVWTHAYTGVKGYKKYV